MDTSFQLLWVNTKEYIGLHGKDILSFMSSCLNCPAKLLYYFVFPLAMNKNFCCSTYSPAFGVFSAMDFGRCDRYAVESHFNRVDF